MKKPYVVITGAAGGIGQGMLEYFAENGYGTVSIDVEEPKVGVSHHITFDLQDAVNSEERCAWLKGEIDHALMGGELRGLINNAAVQVLKGFEHLTRDDWARTLNVNLLAPMFLSQSLISRLRSDGGHIVNISSIHEKLTKKQFAAYSTSKAALSALTRAMSLDLAPHIRVNAIAPAAIETDMLVAGFENNLNGFETLGRYHPLGKIGKVKDIASLAAFLICEEASFMTGQVVGVTGGIDSVLHDPDNFC